MNTSLSPKTNRVSGGSIRIGKVSFKTNPISLYLFSKERTYLIDALSLILYLGDILQ